MANQFDYEIKVLDEIYSDIIITIQNKPNKLKREQSRIYYENVMSYLNKWAVDIKNIKTRLENDKIPDEADIPDKVT